jgi:RNA polymerase primary sigma factor
LLPAVSILFVALHATDTSGISRLVGSTSSHESRLAITATPTVFDSYLAEINRIPLLSANAEKELARLIATGNRVARDQMALANLRLVVRIARGYVSKGLTLEDLIAEGNVGLLRAVEGFDPEMGTRFSTYASYWVKQSIRNALNKSGHTVRLPQYMGSLLVRWRRAEAKFRDEFGREGSQEEVAAHLGLTARQTRGVAKGQKAIVGGQMSGKDGEDALGTLVADGRAGNPDELLDTADALRAALGSLDRLGARQATILRLRFGLGDEEPTTLKEIGKRLGLTRERVRQIERDALAELRKRLENARPNRQRLVADSPYQHEGHSPRAA